MLFVSLEAQSKSDMKYTLKMNQLQSGLGAERWGQTGDAWSQVKAEANTPSARTKEEAIPVLLVVEAEIFANWLLMHVGLVLVHPRCSSTFSVFLHTVWEIPNQPHTASMLFREKSETGFVCDYHATFCAKSHCLPQSTLMSQGPNVFLHLLRDSFTVQQAHL